MRKLRHSVDRIAKSSPGQELVPHKHGVECQVGRLLLRHVGLHRAPQRPCVAPQEVLGQLDACMTVNTLGCSMAGA